MKLAKKLISLTLSIVMVAVLGVAVLAAGTGSITIDNPQPGKTYTAYKIFDVTYSGMAHSYTISKSDPNLSIVQEYAGSTGSGLTLTSAGTVFNVSFSDSTDAFSAPKFAAFLKAKTLSGGITFSSAADGKMKVDGITEGYYFINSLTGTLCELATAKDITIHDKDVAPVISKTHDDADSTVYVGQKVNFTITGVIPATVGYNEYTYLITDEMTPGLDLDGDITVKVDGVVINDSTVSINKASNKKSFTVTITVSAYSAKVGKDIVVTYSAVVNKNAIERDKETNTVTLKYSNDPNNAESYGYASDTANLYSFNVKVDKHAADNTAKKLVGAEFYFKNSSGQYYKRDETTKNVTWVLNKAEATMLSSDTNGVLTFTGIDMGTYYLEETKAPDGYNLLSGVVTVVINKNAANNGYVATVDLHSATVAADNLTVTASIANSTGTMLPETGGTGTIIFIVVGAVAVIGAGLFLVTNKRMSKEGI